MRPPGPHRAPVCSAAPPGAPPRCGAAGRAREPPRRGIPLRCTPAGHVLALARGAAAVVARSLRLAHRLHPPGCARAWADGRRLGLPKGDTLQQRCAPWRCALRTQTRGEAARRSHGHSQEPATRPKNSVDVVPGPRMVCGVLSGCTLTRVRGRNFHVSPALTSRYSSTGSDCMPLEANSELLANMCRVECFRGLFESLVKRAAANLVTLERMDLVSP